MPEVLLRASPVDPIFHEQGSPVAMPEAVDSLLGESREQEYDPGARTSLERTAEPTMRRQKTKKLLKQWQRRISSVTSPEALEARDSDDDSVTRRIHEYEKGMTKKARKKNELEVYGKSRPSRTKKRAQRLSQRVEGQEMPPCQVILAMIDDQFRESQKTRAIKFKKSIIKKYDLRTQMPKKKGV